jgi:transposase
VELFEQLRREHEFAGKSVRALSREFGVHRRMVREALASAIPRERKTAERESPQLEPVKEFIDSILAADLKAPRKQRHTAHRIYVRIGKERPDSSIGESTVRRYAGKRRQELGLRGRETCIPQSYQWGVEGQVDWYEAHAEIDGERRVLQVFCMRSMASGGAFHRAYPRATQQAFLEAHEAAFGYFGGVFQVLRYDNLAAAVKKILRGYEREQTERFIAFRSHWKFQAQFCNAYQGHEKGGVEGENGYFRRQHWTPVPQARDLEDLNAQLLAGSREDEARRIGGRAQTVGEGLTVEREHLQPLTEPGFPLAESSFPQVDGNGRVKVRLNWYSAPVPVGREVEARILPAEIQVWHDGKCVGVHERSYLKGQQILNLEHYLDVLERKPGALAGSTPLEQWRRAGRWPENYDRLWAQLKDRDGRLVGTRKMIELLQLGRRQGWSRLEQAVEQALALGITDAAGVAHLMTSELVKQAARVEPIELGILGRLARYERPEPVVADYDRLLGEGVTA